jgi:CubicO group peptidase (beta-lactamase class C family)
MRPEAVATVALGVLLGVAAVAAGQPGRTTALAAEADPCAAADPIGCLDATLSAGAPDDAYGGVVVVDDGGQEPFVAGYGTQASGEPYAADTTFEIASLGKMFTAVAIGQLLDDGALALDDRAGDHVPTLPAGVADATIAQLLSHTSGLGDSVEEGIPGEPGIFRYTNAGFDVLASIVESVSGQAFGDYLGEHVFEPAGMASTSLSIEGPDGSPIGWGGETSTGPDLLRFVDALASDRLLEPGTTDLFTSPQVENDGGGHYGYGFEIFGDPEGDHSIGHWGLFDLFIGWVNSSDDTTFVVLCDRGCDVMGGPVLEFVEAIGLPG